MFVRIQTFVVALALIIVLSCGFSSQTSAQQSKVTKPAAPIERQEPVQKKSVNKNQTPKKKPNAAMDPVQDVAGLPRVLLIGDSISIGYTVMVREALQGKANVHRPPTNCGPTTNGLKGIEQWLGDKHWDVIHFNWGLHDLKYLGPNGENLQDPNDPTNHQQVPPEEYETNLRTLVERLKKTQAKLIWRNTTPVPEGAKGRVVGDAVKYNAIAAKIMAENGIQVDDVYGLVKPKMQEMMLPKGNVHFQKEGYQAIANDVAAAILQALGS